MTRSTAYIAAAALILSTSIASAQQNQTPRGNSGMSTTGQRVAPDPARGTGTTGAPSSSNPQAGGGPNGLLQAPHEVPENGGAPNSVAPRSNRR